MFCHKCGAQMDDISRFCSVCGTPRPEAAPPVEHTYAPPQHYAPPTYAPPAYTAPDERTTMPLYSAREQVTTPGYAQQPYAQQQSYAPYGEAAPQTAYTPPVVKKKSHLKVIVPSCILLVAAICAAVYFFVFASPQATVGEAMEGLKAEMTERLNSTPLKAVSDLSEALINGSISAEFYSLDYYGDEISGTVTLQSDTEKRDCAILADLDVYGQRYDLSAYINEDRVALGSSLLGGNYYGFKYDTFRQDIKSFGAMVGMDDYTMDMLADGVDTMNEMMNQDAVMVEVNEAYSKAMDDFISSLKPTTTNASLPSGVSSSATYKRHDYVVTTDALVDLLDTYYDILSEDDDLCDYFETVIESAAQYGGDYSIYGSFGYSELLSGLNMLIRQIDSSFDGTVTVSFYLDGSRLVCMSAQLELNVGGATGVIELVCDFGQKSDDPWVFTLSALAPNGMRTELASMRWDYSVNGDKYVNKLTFTMGEGRYAQEVSLGSSWSKSSGAFTLSYEAEGESGKFSGNLKETADGFVLAFDNLGDEYYDEIFELTIKVKKGGKVDEPAYINIDKWDEGLIAMIGELVMASGMY